MTPWAGLMEIQARHLSKSSQQTLINQLQDDFDEKSEVASSVDGIDVSNCSAYPYIIPLSPRAIDNVLYRQYRRLQVLSMG